ncbi:MAG: histone deacetylase, partial [candidate division KSB1 bacterium]|nr:histone deacetylase [candidate division KSB1 bacterium]
MTGFYYHPDFLLHDTGGGHPERPARLTAIMQHLEATGLLSRLHRQQPEPAPLAAIATVHPAGYVAWVQQSCGPRLHLLDSDTVVSQHSFHAAQLAVGAALEAVAQVSAGRLHNAFCAVRPPGHHAETSTAMGFCLFNNVATAADWLIRNRRAEKILIIDWDVHHGNGTQEIFYERGDVYFLSFHEWPLYPGTGREDETGAGAGRGCTRNVTIAPYTPEADYLERFFVVEPEVYEHFKPDFVLLSAGFDAHHQDPLAHLRLTESGFGRMTGLVLELAQTYAAGRVVSL